jgi:protein TonB
MWLRTFQWRTPAPVAIAIAVAMIVGACSKNEPETKPSRGVITAPAPAAAQPPAVAQPADKSVAGATGYAPGEALKERLARQEAASKLMVAAAPTPPPPPRAAEPKPAPPKTPEVARTSAPVQAPAPAPAKAEPPPPPPAIIAAAPPPVPAKTEPAKVEAAIPPRVDVALAKPAAAAPAMRLVNRVEPPFPSEAVKAGVYVGTVRARLIVDASGAVSRVEIVEAQPRRVFDRAVVRALSDWKYNEGAAGRTVTVELAFKAR